MGMMRFVALFLGTAASVAQARQEGVYRSVLHVHRIPRGGIQPNTGASPFPRVPYPNPLKEHELGEQQQQDQWTTQEPERVVSDLSTRDSRVGFIRKVYTILGAQLTVTAAMIIFSTIHRGALSQLLTTNLGGALFGACFVASIACPLLLLMRPSLQHHKLKSFSLLSIFTLAESFLVSVFSQAYNPQAVLFAIVQTAVVTLGLSLYALQPKPEWDMDAFRSYLFTGLMSLITFVVARFIFNVKGMHFIHSVFGSILFSFYIVYDTQRIACGDHPGHSFNKNQYILASLVVYMDIISLFLKLLSLSKEEQ